MNELRLVFFSSENVCNRPWTFERVPNKMLRGLDNALIFTATKESCLAACLNEVWDTIEIHRYAHYTVDNQIWLTQRRFVCRSAEYNYITTKCHLSEHDRRSVDDNVELVDAQGVDYFENLCLKSIKFQSNFWKRSQNANFERNFCFWQAPTRVGIRAST